MKDQQLDRHDYEGRTESHRKLEPDTVNRIGEDRPSFMQKQTQQGQIDIAFHRNDHFESICQRRWNPKLKPWFTTGIVVLGALTFGTGFQTIFKKMNSPFAIGGAALVGAGLTYLVDDRVTKYLAKYRSRQDSEAAISSIDQQHQHHQPQTPIGDTYFSSQKALVRQIEKDHLMINAHLDLGLAMGATALEAGITFFVVSASGSLMLAVLSAALPVSVIWIAAAFQSDRFEFADACEAMIPAYESYLPPSDEVSEKEMLEVWQLDSVARFLSGNGKNGYKSLAEARLATEAKFSWQRKIYYEQAGIAATRDRCEQHKQAVKAMPDKFPVPKIDISNLSPAEQKMQERTIVVQKEQWIAAEIDKLEKDLADDLDFIRAEYGQKVNGWQARAIKAEDDARNANNPDDRNISQDYAA